MSFLAELAALLIGKLVAWFASFAAKEVQQEIAKHEEEKLAEENAKKVSECKTDDERRKASEDLLNNQ